MIKELFKNWKKLLIIILGILVGCILLYFIIDLFKDNVSSENKFEREYEKLNDKDTSDGKKYPSVNISDDNKMKYVSYDEVFDVFNNSGDAVIYIGYSKCLYCRTAVQVLVDTVKDTELDEIYYLNVENKSDGYGKLVDLLGDDFFVSGRVKDKVYVPSVLFVVDGEIVNYNKGTLFSQEDPYEKLEQSQIDELSRIYLNGINDVVKNINLKN